MYPENSIEEAVQRLIERRTVKVIHMLEPGPDDAQMQKILSAAIRVPDHGKLAPWRFIEFNGDAREAFGEVLGRCYQAQKPEASQAQIAHEAARFLRAPRVVAVISRVKHEHKIPVWEQTLSAGAACQNLLVAANLVGFVAQWLTEWYAYDKGVDQALGLGQDERVAGFIYIGSAAEKPPERPRATLEEVHSQWVTPD